MPADATALVPISSLFKYMQWSGGELLLLSLKLWGTNGQNKAGIGLDLLVVMVLLVFLLVVLPLPLMPIDMIFGYRKKTGAHTIRVCCYR